MAQQSVVITIPTARTTLGVLALAAGFKRHELRCRKWAIILNDETSTARLGFNAGTDPGNDTATNYAAQIKCTIAGGLRNDFIFPFEDPNSLENIWCVATVATPVGLFISVV